jgi:hypothetical protein
MYYPVDAYPGTAVLLAVGLWTFLGLVGVGQVLCRLARLRLPEPWETTLSALTGVLFVSLVVEGTAVFFSVPVRGWAAGWWALAAAGLWEGCRLSAAAKSFDWSGAVRNPFFLVAVAANAVTLLIALAPSSRLDELCYHMLVPRRILYDGGLRFYRHPYQGAILPQLHYQILQVLPQALGTADAPNVTSWCFGILLQVFVARSVAGAGAPAGTGAVAAALVSVGMVPAGLHVAAGAHAVGNLASAALIVLATPGPWGLRLCPLRGPPRVLAASLLAIAAASAKLTLLPLAGACLTWAVAGGTLRGNGHGSVCRTFAAALLPWAVFYAPLAVYTAAVSGSPFAVVLPGCTGPSAYASGEVADFLRLSRELNRVGLNDFLFITAASSPPVLWLAAAGIPLLPGGAAVRWYWATVTAATIGVLLLLNLPAHDLRYVAGYPYAALVLAAAVAPADWWKGIARHRLVAGVGASVLVVPWLAGMAYYALPFARCSLGIDSREEFAHRFTAFRDDFLRLDGLLPPDAVVLAGWAPVRLNAVNAPRPVVLDVRDLPPGRPTYLFAVNDVVPPLGPLAIGATVYENPAAIVVAYRKPGALPVVGRLRVSSLQPGRSNQP